MKKLSLFISLMFILVMQVKVCAFNPPDMQHNLPNARIGIGTNYGNTLHTNNRINTGNHVIINHSNPTMTIITPPPPPPLRHLYRYKDFEGDRKYPRRSYYIPSYCMPETEFNTYIYSPFCNHYRPYGSNMYISF